jgi:adenylate cyclase
MAIEIERKFLLANNTWRALVHQSTRIAQAYLNDSQALADGREHCSVRVRVFNQLANINIKSRELGAKRQEFEYPIALQDAEQLMALSSQIAIDKTRHLVHFGEHLWEIDEFAAENTGLIVAEIELDDEHEHFQRPDWLGQEVTDQLRYYNMQLSAKPYARWSDEEKQCS